MAIQSPFQEPTSTPDEESQISQLYPQQRVAQICESLLKGKTNEDHPDETDKIFSIEDGEGQRTTMVFTPETWVDTSTLEEHKGMLVTRIVQEGTGAVTIAQLAYKPFTGRFEIIRGTNGEKLLEMFANSSLVEILIEQLGEQQNPAKQEVLERTAIIKLRKKVIEMFGEHDVIGFDFLRTVQLTFQNEIRQYAINLGDFDFTTEYVDENEHQIPFKLILKALAEAYFVYSTEVLGDFAHKARKDGTDVQVLQLFNPRVPRTSLLEAKPITITTYKSYITGLLANCPDEIKLAPTTMFILPFGVTILLEEQREISTLAINSTTQNPRKLIIKAENPMRLLELVQRSQDTRLKSPISGEKPLFFDNPELFKRLSQIKDLVRLLGFNPTAADVRFDSPISFGYKIEPEDTLSAGVSVEMDLEQGNLVDKITKLSLQERATIYKLLTELYPEIEDHTKINLIKTPIIHPVGINLDGPIKRTSPLQLQQIIDTGEITIKGDGASIRIAKNGEITTIYSPQRQQGRLVGKLDISLTL